MAESGGSGVLYNLSTLPGGFNSTVYQTLCDRLVSSTSCASTLQINIQSSLSCLPQLPFNELNLALNGSSNNARAFLPFMDNDFISTYPSIQLSRGDFVKVPFLIGANTDEGTAFGAGKEPNGTGINTTAEFSLHSIIPGSLVLRRLQPSFHISTQISKP